MGRKPSRDRNSDADDQTPPAEPERTRGGRRPMSTEQQRLVIRYLPMARALARPLKATWPGDGNEFESAACLALVEAAQSFDASRNVKFATFARYRIMGALRDAQRMIITGGWKNDEKYAAILTNCFPDVEEMGKVLGGAQDPPIGSDLEAIDAVEGWLRKLPPSTPAPSGTCMSTARLRARPRSFLAARNPGSPTSTRRPSRCSTTSGMTPSIYRRKRA